MDVSPLEPQSCPGDEPPSTIWSTRPWPPASSASARPGSCVDRASKVAIEVKLTDTIRHADVEHLNWLGQQLGDRLVDRMFIYTDSQRRPPLIRAELKAVLAAHRVVEAPAADRNHPMTPDTVTITIWGRK